ncbi:hypothetical protein GCM10009552_42330 [Rothia nasimurium]
MHHAAFFQRIERAAHGVAVDLKLAGQFQGGGQAVAAAQHAVVDLPEHLLFDLAPDRHVVIAVGWLESVCHQGCIFVAQPWLRYEGTGRVWKDKLSLT